MYLKNIDYIWHVINNNQHFEHYFKLINILISFVLFIYKF